MSLNFVFLYHSFRISKFLLFKLDLSTLLKFVLFQIKLFLKSMYI